MKSHRIHLTTVRVYDHFYVFNSTQKRIARLKTGNGDQKLPQKERTRTEDNINIHNPSRLKLLREKCEDKVDF